MAEKEVLYRYTSIKKGQFDNNYTFYTDGTVLHEYDLHVRKLDLSEIINAKDIYDNDKAKILIECPIELKEELSKLMGLS